MPKRSDALEHLRVSTETVLEEFVTTRNQLTDAVQTATRCGTTAMIILLFLGAVVAGREFFLKEIGDSGSVPIIFFIVGVIISVTAGLERHFDWNGRIAIMRGLIAKCDADKRELTSRLDVALSRITAGSYDATRTVLESATEKLTHIQAEAVKVRVTIKMPASKIVTQLAIVADGQGDFDDFEINETS